VWRKFTSHNIYYIQHVKKLDFYSVSVYYAIGGAPMAEYTRFINDAQWELLKSLLPEPRKYPKGGRPPADNREALEGILWILRTGARWQDLPERYPSASTCWQRLLLWEEQGVCGCLA
jgi:hypothetical protein